MWAQPDGWYVRDLGSVNGTYLNDRRIEPRVPQRLYDGDVVRFAADVRARVTGGGT